MADEKDIKVDVEQTTEDDEALNTPMDRFFFHQRRALEETGKALEALLPPDFRRHGGQASREFARGFRVLVDAAIDELKKVSEREDDDEDEDASNGPPPDDTSNDDDKPSTTGKTKVKVKLD